MTDAQAKAVFDRIRGRMTRRYPVLADVRLRLVDRHFLKQPTARDLAWYEGGVVTVLRRALRGPAGRFEGLLAHELGHAADPDTDRPYAERRADALAKAALGAPIRYDNEDVQNLDHGVTPRPARLHENRETTMRNPATKAEMQLKALHGTLTFPVVIWVDDGEDEYTIRYTGGTASSAEQAMEVAKQNATARLVLSRKRPVVSSIDPADVSTAPAEVKEALRRKPCWVVGATRLARNPHRGYKMPEAQARHTADGLLARMLADGADTFAKKVKWVKRHMPNIDQPRTFVGWVTKGERGRVMRNPRPLVREANLGGDVGKYYTIESVQGAGKPLYALTIFDSNTAEQTSRNYPSIAMATVAMYQDAAKSAGVKPKDLHRWFVEYEAKGLHANPSPAYHRTRGDAELVLAEDSYRKAQALRRRGNASGSHDALIHAHRMAALAEADLLDGASPKAADAKRLAWWKAYSGLAADKRRNPR
jgi:hypothetical protein